MTSDELREQIAMCKREAAAMSAHRDFEFAAGARTAAEAFGAQLRGQEARKAGQARARATKAAEGLPVAA